MAHIVKIKATIVTSDVENAQTDGRVYLGICGREFRCDSAENDFERAIQRVFRFGLGADINHANLNDPRRPQLEDTDADLFPVYIRFDQGDSDQWKLKSVEVKLNDDGPIYVNALSQLWMGLHASGFCYLKRSQAR